jgi:hypothetical protein
MTIAHLLDGAMSIDLFPGRRLERASRRSSEATRRSLEAETATPSLSFASTKDGSILILTAAEREAATARL